MVTIEHNSRRGRYVENKHDDGDWNLYIFTTFNGKDDDDNDDQNVIAFVIGEKEWAKGSWTSCGKKSVLIMRIFLILLLKSLLFY